jgi:hypothetical protein
VYKWVRDLKNIEALHVTSYDIPVMDDEPGSYELAFSVYEGDWKTAARKLEELLKTKPTMQDYP